MKHLFIFLLLAAIPKTLLAEVDVRNGNYYDSWEDISLSSDGTPFKLIRYYNSRSLFSGVFGFGWCTDFETQIITTVEGNISLSECGGGQEISFVSKNNSPQKITSNIDLLIEKIKSQKRNLGSSFFSDLKEKLINDEAYRKKLSSDYGIASPVSSQSSEFYSTNGKADKIEFSGGIYTRVLASGEIQKFDSSGNLIFLQNNRKENFKISYTNGKISSIVDGNSKKLNFNYYPTGKVKSIIGPSSIQSEYKFEGENLVSITNGWGNKYSYQYDSLHNLTRINYPDGSFRQLAYDETRDLIKSFKDRAGCVETFSYTISKDDPKLHYWTNAEKKCDSKVVSQSKFEFWHKERSDGQKALSRVISSVKGQTKEVVLDPVWGRPISSKDNGVASTYDYYDSGLLRSKITREDGKPTFNKFIYTYDKINRLTVIESASVDSGGKEAGQYKINYTYNEKGQLTGIGHSSGSNILLAYDKDQKITKITNGAKVFSLSYDSSSGRPKEIKTQNQTLEITYSNSGEISSLKSSGGPEAAKKITGEFSYILSLLQPADVKINI